MITIGEALLLFKGDDSQLKNKLSDVENESRSWAGRVGDFLNGAFQFAAGGLIKDGIEAIGGAIMSTGKEALESYAYFERLGSSMAALSAQELVTAGNFDNINDAMATANKIGEKNVQWVKELAAESPFDLKKSAEALQVAEAYGFVASSVRDVKDAQEQGLITAQRVTQAAVDAAAATGKDADVVARITRELGQMNTMQKVTTGGLNSLAMAGVNARKYLADAFTDGDIPKLMGMIESGAIDADKAVEVLTLGVEKDFGGAAKRQANTFSGLLSTMSDLAEFAKIDLFSGIFKAAQPYLTRFVEILGSEQISNSLKGIGDMLGQYVAGALEFVSRAVGFLQDRWEQLAPVIERVSEVLSVVGDIFGQVASDAYNWGAEVVSYFADGISSMIGAVSDSLGTIGDMVGYWLEPHSPPKLLPNIDQWGADTMGVYLQGFEEADFGVFDKLSGALENAIKGMTAGGQMDDKQGIAALLGGRAAFAEAISELNRTGTIGEATFQKIKDAAGPAGDQVLSLTKNYLALSRATKELDKAQEDQKNLEIELMVAQAEQLAAQQDGSTADQARANSNLRRLKDERQQAREREKKAAEEKGRVDAQIKQQEMMMKFQTEQNELLKKQNDLLDKMAEKEKKAKKDKDKEAERLARAQEAYNMALMTTAEKIDYLRDKLAKLNPNQEEYWQTLGQIKGLEDQRNREVERAADKQLQWELDHTDNLDKQIALLKEQQSQYAEGSDEWKRYQAQIESVQKKQEADAKRRADAEWNYKYAIADNAGKMEMLKAKLAEQTEGSEEYYQTLTKIAALEDQEEKKAKGRKDKGDKPGGVKKTPPIVLPEDNAETLGDQAADVINKAMERGKMAFNMKVADLPKILLKIIPQIAGAGLKAVPGLLALGGKVVVAILDGIGTYMPKIWEWEGKLFSGLLDVATKNLPSIMAMGTKVILSIGDAIVRNTPKVLQGMVDLFQMLLESIIKNLPAWGAELLKLADALADALVNWVVEAAPKLLEELGKVQGDVVDWIIEWAPKLTDELLAWGEAFLKWIGPTAAKLVIGLGKMVGKMVGIALKWLVTYGPKFIVALLGWVLQIGTWLVTKGIPALIGAFGSFVSIIWGEITKLWDAAFAEGSLGKSIIDSIVNTINGWGAGISAWWTNTVTAPFTSSVEGMGTSISEKWNGFWQGIQDWANQKIQEISDSFNKWLDDLLTWMGLNPKEMRARWAKIWEDIHLIATTLIEKVRAWVAEKIQFIVNWVKDKMAWLQDKWATIWKGIQDVAQKIWDATGKAAIEWITKNVVKPIQEKIEELSKWWDKTWKAIQKIAANIWDAIVREVVQPLQDLYQKIVDKVDDIKRWLGDQKDEFVQYGKDFVQGIIDGVGEMAGALAEAATRLVEEMIRKAKEALGINSPSRVARRLLGWGTGEGIILGLEDQQGPVNDAMVDLTDSMFDGVNGKKMTVGVAVNASLDRMENLIERVERLEEKPTILITGNTLQGQEDLDQLAEQLATKIARRRSRG